MPALLKVDRFCESASGNAKRTSLRVSVSPTLLKFEGKIQEHVCVPGHSEAAFWKALVASEIRWFPSRAMPSMFHSSKAFGCDLVSSLIFRSAERTDLRRTYQPAVGGDLASSAACCQYLA